MRVQTQARGPYGRIDYSILVLVCCTLASLFFGCKEVSRSSESPSNTETAKKTGVVARTHAEATREKTKAKNPWVEGVTRESQTYSTGRDCELGQPGCRCKMPAYKCTGTAECFYNYCYGEGFPAPDTYRYTKEAEHDYGRIKDLILTNLKLEAGMNVADLGAGRGNYAFPIAEKVGAEGTVYVTDVDPGAIKELSRKKNARLERPGKFAQFKPILVEGVRDTGLQGLPDNHLDLILMVNSVTFEARDDREQSFRYLGILLSKMKKGGRVLYHTDWYDPSEGAGLDRQGIIQLFADAGFASPAVELPLPAHIPEETFFLKFNVEGGRVETPLKRGYIFFFEKP